jgi:toxin ParE1/3/4
MKLRYERGALADLKAVFEHIAADDRQAAARLVAAIEEVGKLIALHPYIGAATRKGLFRQFPIGRYLIVYEVGQDEVVIYYVRHSARRRSWESA